MPWRLVGCLGVIKLCEKEAKVRPGSLARWLLRRARLTTTDIASLHGKSPFSCRSDNFIKIFISCPYMHAQLHTATHVLHTRCLAEARIGSEFDQAYLPPNGIGKFQTPVMEDPDFFLLDSRVPENLSERHRHGPDASHNYSQC